MSRRAVVTGSSSGIGLAIANHLLQQGWRVDGIDCQAAVIRHTNLTHHAVELASAGACEEAARALAHEPAPAALIHAAGFMSTGPLGQIDILAAERMWAVHVQAASVLANALIPAMLRQGWGRIILIGSRVAQGMAGRSQYAASKAALIGLARSWAAETAGRGVTVNVISPAATDTPMLRDSGRSNTPPRTPPLGRFIRPDEVASLTAYLLSDPAEAITGQDIAICGGASVRS